MISIMVVKIEPVGPRQERVVVKGYVSPNAHQRKR